MKGVIIGWVVWWGWCGLILQRYRGWGVGRRDGGFLWTRFFDATYYGVKWGGCVMAMPIINVIILKWGIDRNRWMVLIMLGKIILICVKFLIMWAMDIVDVIIFGWIFRMILNIDFTFVNTILNGIFLVVYSLVFYDPLSYGIYSNNYHYTMRF